MISVTSGIGEAPWPVALARLKGLEVRDLTCVSAASRRLPWCQAVHLLDVPSPAARPSLGARFGAGNVARAMESGPGDGSKPIKIHGYP